MHWLFLIDRKWLFLFGSTWLIQPDANSEKKKAELEALYIAICEVLYDYDSFIDAATELTTFFEDGHTNIELPYTPQDLCLNLKCCWRPAMKSQA